MFVNAEQKQKHYSLEFAFSTVQMIGYKTNQNQSRLGHVCFSRAWGRVCLFALGSVIGSLSCLTLQWLDHLIILFLITAFPVKLSLTIKQPALFAHGC